MPRVFDAIKFQEEKEKALLENFDELSRIESDALRYAPIGVDWKNAKFELREAKKGFLNIHHYFYQVISSFPNNKNDTAGNRWLFNLWETNSQKIVGVLRISSDFLRLGPRDKHLGLPTGFEKIEQTTVQLKGVIPLPPFSLLVGGKLLTALAFTSNVQRLIKDKMNLTGVSVCSIYGESIVYDRIPYLKYLGETEGGTGVYYGEAKERSEEEIMAWWHPLFERRLIKVETSMSDYVFRVTKKVQKPSTSHTLF